MSQGNRSASSTLDAWWRRVGMVAVGLALAALVLGAGWVLARPLALLLSSLVLASAMAGPVRFLERWLARLPATLLAYGTSLAIVGAVTWYVATRLLLGPQGVLALVPTAIERADELLAGLDPAIGRRVEQALESALENAGAGLAEAPAELAISVAEVVLVVVMSVYWVLAAEDALAFTLSLFPPHQRASADAVIREMARTMGGFVRANVVAAAIVGAVVYAGLLLLGVPYPLGLALVAMVGEVIPVIGPYLAAVPILAVAVSAGPYQAGGTVVLLVAVKAAETYVLLPRLARQLASIPPLLVIFALIAGATAGELLGAVVAVPLAGALRVLVIRVVAPAIRRRTTPATRPRREVGRDEETASAAD